MKLTKLIPVFMILALTIGMDAFGQGHANKTANKNFAVLELFTSEGCSSCPPADELIGKLQNEYKDREVYILSYHVDYWDKQGWKDIFSDADYTKRQYDYAEWLQKEPIYTPQLIVNGKAEYIGSQETIVINAITKALLKPTTADLSLKTSQTKDILTVNHTIKGVSKNSRLLIAIVQKSAKIKVKRGENAHRILLHFQIVRHLHSIALNTEGIGTTNITLPKDFNITDFEVIGFVQDVSNGSIEAVTKAVF